MKKICFAGHSNISGEKEIGEKLYEVIESLMLEEEAIEFFVGNYGAFDRLSATVVKKLKEKHPKIKLNLVIPYLTKEINQDRVYLYGIYDEILLADIPKKTPKKIHILMCNRYMVDLSEILICYVNASGGAAKTLEYARNIKGIKIINIAEQINP